MGEQKKFEWEVVRAVITRPQQKPHKVGHEQPQVLMVQRPDWSNIAPGAWQLVGGQFEPTMSTTEAMPLRIADEVGVNLQVEGIALGEYVFDTTLSHALYFL